MSSDSASTTSEAIRPFEVTSAMVVAIALPTMLAFISTPLLGLVDTGVVGQLGDAAMLGGLAVGAILFDIVFTTFNFLRASTTGLVAQAMGAGDHEQQRVVCIRSLIIAVLAGFVILALSPLILRFGLPLMQVSESVAAATAAYFVIRILAAPFTLINYSILGWLLGQARAKAGLLLQTVLNGVNIALSIFLGLHMGWGLEGVAWATVTAEVVAAFVGLGLFWRSMAGRGAIDWQRVFNREALARLFGVNRDIMIRSFCLLFAFAFFTAQGAQFGEVTLAANAVLMNFFLISGYMLDGFATAAEQLAGRAIGARYRPAFDRTVKLTMIWGLILAVASTLIFLLAGPFVIDLLTTAPDIRAEARVYLVWAAISAIVGVAAFQMDGVYIGATWSVEMRNMMLISLAAYLLVWWFAVAPFGNHGLWLALEVFLGMRGATMLLRLRSKTNQEFAHKKTPVQNTGAS